MDTMAVFYYYPGYTCWRNCCMWCLKIYYKVISGHDLKMLRYSEMPRDLSADSIATLKLSDVATGATKPTSKDEQYYNKSSHPHPNNDRSSTCLHLDEANREPPPSIIHRLQRKISTPCASTTTHNRVDIVPPYTYYNYGNAFGSSTPTPPPSALTCHYQTQYPPSLPLEGAVIATVKAQSLPSSARTYSCAVLDVLRVPPDELAAQLTLLDLPPFMAIEPDELTSCGWSKRNKLTVAPNVVGFTRRFNHVSFWTVQEILSGATTKHRSDILSHFIRVAKKLYDLNNLHSLFAIVSALQSVSIYRLSKTWSNVSKKDKQTFDRLAEVFSDTNNWQNLRTHIESLKLPCIPYLGLYLTDLVYIDMAHPHSGGLESQQRQLRMNNILRVISNYQQSNYEHLRSAPHVRDYLNSIRYIEELQKFVEDDQYKLSLKLEPPTQPQVPNPSTTSSSGGGSSASGSAESVTAQGYPPPLQQQQQYKQRVDISAAAAAIASLNLSPAKGSTGCCMSSGSLRLQRDGNGVVSGGGGGGKGFLPGHRKCRSLGTKFRSASLPRNFHKQWGIFNKNYQVTSIDAKDLPKALHLLDDSELEEQNSIQQQVIIPSPCSDMHLQASRNTAEDTTLLTGNADDCIGSGLPVVLMQGCVKRKTVLKRGRKPTVSSWQRYWIQIWASSLAYFAPKSFKGNQRSDFKSEPCKMVSLVGNQIVFNENALHPDLFQIVDQQRGNVYKFRVGSQSLAVRWCRHLQQATSADRIPLPTNLMSFE